MGACGSNKDRKKNKKDETPGDGGDIKTPGNEKIIKIEGNPNEEKKGEEETSKLRNARKENFEQREYNYELKDLIKNKEVKDKIASNCKIFELLNRWNFRANCDFIIEFENNYKIGY